MRPCFEKVSTLWLTCCRQDVGLLSDSSYALAETVQLWPCAGASGMTAD